MLNENRMAGGESGRENRGCSVAGRLLCHSKDSGPHLKAQRVTEDFELRRNRELCCIFDGSL